MKNGTAKRKFAGAGWMAAAFLGVGAFFLLLDEDGQAPAPGSAPPAERSQPPSEAAIPAFHPDAESARPFPALVDPSRYEVRVVSRAYEIAHQIPEVLAQQPCYCNCGVFGHTSLLDCFASDHGAT